MLTSFFKPVFIKQQLCYLLRPKKTCPNVIKSKLYNFMFVDEIIYKNIHIFVSP